MRKFDFKGDLVSEAFGGDPAATEAATGDAMTEAQLAAFLTSGAQSYGKSAYMLIYERKSKKNLREHTKDENGEDQVSEVEFRSVQKYVPDWISDVVYADNKSFLVDSQLFSDLFFDCIKMTFRVIA